MRLTVPARSRTAVPSAAIVCVIALCCLADFSSTTLYVLAVGVAYAIAAVGLDLIAGYSGLLSMGQFAFVALGAYSGAIFRARLGWPWVLAMVGAMLFAALVAYVIGLALVRLSGVGFAAATFFLGYVVVIALGGSHLSDLTGSQIGLTVQPLTDWRGHVLEGKPLLYVLLVVLLVVVMLTTALVASRPGRRLRLAKHNNMVAETLGVSVLSARLGAFAWAGGTAGLAGFFLGPIVGIVIPQSFTADESIKLFAMVVVGGMGSIGGPVLGAVGLTLLDNQFAGTAASQIFFAVLLLLTLLVFPNGIYGVLDREFVRRIRRWSLSRGRPLLQSRGRLFAGRGRAGLGGDGDSRSAEPDSPGVPSPPPRVGGGASRPAVPAARGGDPIIEVSGLGVTFGGVDALTDVSLKIWPDSVHSIVGPNGAGKTTLLNCISGIQPVHAGRVVIGNVEVTREGARRRHSLGVARTFQHPAIAPDLSVLENVRVGTKADRATAVDALTMLRIDRRYWHAPASTLSLAQLKVLDIARSVASNPRVILMDEPTAGLAERDIDELADVIVGLRENLRLMLVIVAHHVGFVRALSDELTVLADGRVMRTGTPDEVLADSRVVDAFLGTGTAEPSFER